MGWGHDVTSLQKKTWMSSHLFIHWVLVKKKKKREEYAGKMEVAALYQRIYKNEWRALNTNIFQTSHHINSDSMQRSTILTTCKISTY